MKKKLFTKLISAMLASAMMFTATFDLTAAAASKDAYVSEVFIAYGSTVEEAKKWLTDNGWEPVEGDLQAGKTSAYAEDVVAVMGIKRTSDPNNAITDMAVMNMYGDYSFDDYDALVAEKKADINEFLYSFIPVLNEYRKNYNGEGSEGGKKRAQYAHDLLNKFYDGDVNGKYAVHDTGKQLGDLLLHQTRLEYGEAKYDALSKEEQLNYADFQQIILESSGPAVDIIEQTLALASDSGKDSWLDRVNGLSGDNLIANIGYYVPEAKGQSLSASAAKNYLKAKFGDAARTLATQWKDIQADLIWFEQYNELHGLEYDEDEETPEEYSARVEAYFADLNSKDPEGNAQKISNYISAGRLYDLLSITKYPGKWGETMLDFFYPENNKNYGTLDNFLPLAAALSEGQRAGIQFLSLRSLLNLAMNSDAVMEAQFPSMGDTFGELDRIDVYSGINRAIFRSGVALTQNAKNMKRMGYDPYSDLWDESGMISIMAYSAIGLGAVSLVVGGVLASTASKIAATLPGKIAEYNAHVSALKTIMEQTKWVNDSKELLIRVARSTDASAVEYMLATRKVFDHVKSELNALEKTGTTAMEKEVSVAAGKFSTASKWLMGIGGALMIGGAIVKIIQIIKANERDFVQIPMMLVDEGDIVTYLYDDYGNPILDEQGKHKRDINFDQFVYYEVVKCNRQSRKLNKKAQGNVDKYVEWGCGDAADLGCDIGKQWLALYTNKSREKGNPILANSIKVQMGSITMPSGWTNSLHEFGSTFPINIADGEYNFNDKMNGIYVFWKSDEKAFTATLFTFGYLALAAGGGLIIGAAVITLIMLPKRKKERAAEPTTA